MSVSIRRLSTDEVEQTFRNQDGVDLTPYVQAVQEVGLDGAAEVPINGLTPRTVRRRFNKAARSLGFRLRWATNPDAESTILFMVQPPSNPRRKRS